MDQAIESGFRNSGISIGAGKIIIAVRSTQFLECPISRNGDLLVDEKVNKVLRYFLLKDFCLISCPLF